MEGTQLTLLLFIVFIVIVLFLINRKEDNLLSKEENQLDPLNNDNNIDEQKIQKKENINIVVQEKSIDTSKEVEKEETKIKDTSNQQIKVEDNLNNDLFNSLRSKDSPLIKEAIDNLKLSEIKIYDNTFSIISSKSGLGKTSMLVSIAKDLSKNKQILFIDLEKTKSAATLLGIDYPGDEIIHDTNTKNLKYLFTNKLDINSINRILEKNLTFYNMVIVDMPIIKDEISLSWIKFIKNFFIILDLDFITLKSLEDSMSILEENIDLEKQNIKQVIVNKFDASNHKNIDMMKILNTNYSNIPISFVARDDYISQKILENNYSKLYENIFDKVI